MIFFDNLKMEILAIFIAFVTAVYYYVKHKHSYWARKGVEYLKPHFLFGNMPNTFLGKENFILETQRNVESINGRFGGMYFATRPSLIVKDPELIKQILVKDFDVFTDRGLYLNERVDPLTGNLFTLHGDKWRRMRSKLSPTFTSGKLKQMVPIFVTIAQRLQNYVEKIATSTENKIEAHDMMSRYTIDSITSLAFGVEIDCINNADEMFRTISQRIANPTPKQFYRRTLAEYFPKLADYFNFRTTDDEVENFLRSVTKQTLDLRENKKVTRNDFMQLLIQLRNIGKLNENDKLETEIADGRLYY